MDFSHHCFFFPQICFQTPVAARCHPSYGQWAVWICCTQSWPGLSEEGETEKQILPDTVPAHFSPGNQNSNSSSLPLEKVMIVKYGCKILEYSMKLNWGSFYSEYVRLASQAGGENRTEQGVPWSGAGPSPHAQRRAQRRPSPGVVRGQRSGCRGPQREAQEGATGRSEAEEGRGEREGIYSRGTVEIKGNYVTLMFCKRSRNVSN